MARGVPLSDLFPFARAKRGVVAIGLSAALGACAPGGAMQSFRQSFTPGQATDDSHLHAMQAASFTYAFMDAHLREWDARLAAIEDDLPPFFAALEASGFRADIEVVAHPPSAGGAAYEYYGANLVLTSKAGKARVVVTGEEGMGRDAYAAALAPAAAATGIPPEVIRRGHFALFALATMSGSLNGTDDAIRRLAFGLLVVRERLKNHEPNADNLAPLKPADKSLEDVDLALRVLADHHAETSRLRGEVLATLALARAYEVPEARAELGEQVKDSRKRAAAWRATHHRPTAEEYGVAAKPLVLPTPDAMLAVLDKDGYLSAAVKIAKGVAARDPAATVEALGRLAPPNSSLRVASEGTAAALRGDVRGTANAVLALAEKNDDLAPAVARLRSVEAVVAEAKANADRARGTVDDARSLVKPPRK